MIERVSAASYPSDPALLAELRAGWPPGAAADEDGRGYVTADRAARPPDAAVRLGDRLGVALIAEPGGSFLAIPLARDDILVTSWRAAAPGDGLSAFVAGVPLASERSIDVDQTNASVVVGERAIVKWYRRIGPGTSRAALLAAHLDAVGFAEMPPPLGWLTWAAPSGPALTIAQGDAYLPGARDGWDWCLARLERHVAHRETDCPADCEPWIGTPLGRLVARLHAALRTPSAVIPDPLPADGASTATIERWRADAATTLADALRLTAADDATAGSILAAIEPALRADLDALRPDRPIGLQPVHGDLHVGQILEWQGGLAVIDFDGNPALGDAGNAILQPPERDIAQMLSSLDHLGRVVDERTAGHSRPIVETWIARTRHEFLAASHPDVALLAAFEAEQECRELVYAARFLPRWRATPLATLRARYGA